jgi:hypothetical protein
MANPTTGDLTDAFPEFREADGDLLSSRLTAAIGRVDAEVWGPQWSNGVLMLAAHLLAISPYGQNARLSAKDGSSTYLAEYERMRLEVSFGVGRVL